MSQYPDYRLIAEAIILRDNKVLLTKRSDNSTFAPGAWHVPGGKVEYEEIPIAAIARECKEEIGLDIKIVKELNVRIFKMLSENKEAFRLIYTYLANIQDDNEPILNNEHTDYAWVGLEELKDKKYESLLITLKEIIEEKVLKAVC